MRQALNGVVTDRRFLGKSVTPLEVAEHILQQAASGERDLNRLKSSAFEKLGTPPVRGGQMAVRTTVPRKADLRVPCSQAENDLPAQRAIGVLVRPALPRALRIERKNIRRWSLTESGDDP